MFRRWSALKVGCTYWVLWMQSGLVMGSSLFILLSSLAEFCEGFQLSIFFLICFAQSNSAAAEELKYVNHLAEQCQHSVTELRCVGKA